MEDATEFSSQFRALNGPIYKSQIATWRASAWPGNNFLSTKVVGMPAIHHVQNVFVMTYRWITHTTNSPVVIIADENLKLVTPSGALSAQ